MSLKYNISHSKITLDLKVKFNSLENQNMIAPNADLVNLDINPFIEKNWILPLKKNQSNTLLGTRVLQSPPLRMTSRTIEEEIFDTLGAQTKNILSIFVSAEFVCAMDCS